MLLILFLSLGPFIGGIPAAIIILFVSPIQALWFIVIIVVIQQIDGNIIGELRYWEIQLEYLHFGYCFHYWLQLSLWDL